MSIFFTAKSDNDHILFCHNDGKDKFHVINGGWTLLCVDPTVGKYQVLCPYKESEADITWLFLDRYDVDVPDSVVHDYNRAIDWFIETHLNTNAEKERLKLWLLQKQI